MVEKLKQDMIDAMKEKDKDRLTTIRMIKGDLDKEHIDKKREINDELLIEVLDEQIGKVKVIVKNIMENVVKFDIPLLVDVKVGKNWGEVH